MNVTRKPSHRLLLAVAFVATLGIACIDGNTSSSSRQAPVVNGIDDDGDLGVVALLDSEFHVYCGGTLIAPRVVLTAAHCLGGQTAPKVFLGATPDQWISSGDGEVVAHTESHPEFSRDTLENDIGLILLEQPFPALIYPLHIQPFDNSFVGRTIRLVGFGHEGVGANTGEHRKREGFTTISEYTDLDFSFGPNPSLTCHSDSGGPAFLDIAGVDYVAGVTSSGDPDCATQGTNTRVDPYIEDFIQPFIDSTGEGVVPTGDSCFYDAHCQTGLCVPARDEPRLKFCANSCTSDDDCSPELECASLGQLGSQCVYPLPTPGALGGPCESDADCLNNLCAAPSNEVARRCTDQCFLGVPNACPDDHECLVYAEMPSRYGCFLRSPKPGCSCSAGGAFSGGQLFLVLCVLLGLWRRSRYRPRERSCCTMSR